MSLMSEFLRTAVKPVLGGKGQLVFDGIDAVINGAQNELLDNKFHGSYNEVRTFLMKPALAYIKDEIKAVDWPGVDGEKEEKVERHLYGLFSVYAEAGVDAALDYLQGKLL